MAKFFTFNMLNTKRETKFIIAGIMLLIITLTFSVYTLYFLVHNLRLALGKGGDNNAGVVRFNLEGVKELGISQ